MKVSIIIPIYNAEEYISECLDSVVNQSYHNLEIICVNDGSEDNSAKIVDEYKNNDARIILINQKNKGLSSARNEGLKIATGEYIFFCDSDDKMDPDLVKKSLAYAQNTNADVVLFDVYNIFDDIIIRKNRISSFIKKKKKTEFYYKENKHIIYQNPSVWSKLFKKSFLDKNNMFFNEKILFGEDSPFWAEFLFCNPKIALLNESLYYYRKRKNGLTQITKDIINKQWNVYLSAKDMLWDRLSEEERLFLLDIETSYAVNNYSAINNISQLIPFELGMMRFLFEYRKFSFYNCLKSNGFQILVFRHFFLILKNLYIFILKMKSIIKKKKS